MGIKLAAQTACHARHDQLVQQQHRDLLLERPQLLQPLLQRGPTRTGLHRHAQERVHAQVVHRTTRQRR